MRYAGQDAILLDIIEQILCKELFDYFHKQGIAA